MDSEELQPTLILGDDDETEDDGARANDGEGDNREQGDGAKEALSDATTVDEEQDRQDQSGEDSRDMATSAENRAIELEDEVQPTLILDTQVLESPKYEGTQLLSLEQQETMPVLLEQEQSEVKSRVASVRLQSLSRSAMAAYERLLQKRPEEQVGDSAKLVLEWGKNQAKILDRKGSIVEENLEENLAVTSTGVSKSSATTPVSQTLKNISVAPAMWSNNKKSTSNQKSGSSSPRKQESTLDRVRKVLFEKSDLSNHYHPPQPLRVIVATAEITDRPVKELSYLNSQEPGEESQANALDALDRLVSSNGDFSQEAQLNEFEVEPKKTNLLSSRIAQLQVKNPASVFDFVTSQEDPLMGAAEAAAKDDELVAGENVDAQDLDKAKESEELEKQDVENKRKEPSKPSNFDDPKPSRGRKTSTSTPTAKNRNTASKRKAPSPNENPDRGKRGRKTSPGVRAHQPGSKAAEEEPRTPRNSGEGTRAAQVVVNSKSRARKRKIDVEKLILADDTPRRCRRKPVKVLFSHSLDKDTIEEQKKILKKLKFAAVTKAGECTHFVTDRFMRTANMLEVLAAGKPVVGVAWLESCSVAGCAVDEKMFIVEDSRKEKELGFCMQTTYHAAQQKLLLEGKKVHVTPKANQEMATPVVQAAGGKVVSKSDATGDCLVISCEQDRKYCLPLIKNGAKIYSLEFLLSGVVRYHLDYSKNLLFER